jgi:transcriptional regulator with GAF, ATPase, and Fis domain
VRDVVPVTPLRGAEPDNPLLMCPDCGVTLQLALVPSATRRSRPESVGARISRVSAESDPLPDFEDSVRRYKRDLISRALEENDGVMTRAAKALGLKYTTFVAMVHRLDVSSPESEDAGS